MNRNFGSLVGRLNLLTASNAVETGIQRLSSGARINSAADDSAGMAVVSKMDTQIAGLSVAIKNSMDAISLFDTASVGLQTTASIAQRVRELAVQNSNGHLSTIDRAAAQLEVDALNAELLRIAAHTNFNKIALLDGTLDTTMQIGNTVFEKLTIDIDGVETTTPVAETAAATGSSTEVLSPTGAGTAISAFDTPDTSRASGTSALDYLSSSTAAATSAFDTPTESTASGSSSLDVPVTNSTVTTLAATSGGNTAGYGASSRSILPTNTATTTSAALDYLLSSAATDPSNRWANPTSTTTGIPASSTASVTTASVIDSLNFAGGVFNSGWDIVQSQIELGSSGSVTAEIDGFATPTDSEPDGSAGDGTAGQIATSLGNSSIDWDYSATASSMTLSTNEIKTASKGIVHGPAMISSDAISLNTGDVVSFDWEFTGVGSAGDYADVYAYLLNTSDGSTVELTDYTHNASGGTGNISVSETLGADIDGFYKFVFVSGAYDNDGGSIVGSEVIVSNLSVTDTAGDSKTSTASTTLEAQESSVVSIARSSLASLESKANSDSNLGSYALSGTDASYFSIDQTTGNITSSALLRSVKNSYSFDVTYTRSDGGYHKESVTVDLTPALFATTTAYAQESDAVSIALSDMSELASYVSSNGGGTFSIAATGSDYANFSIDASSGAITSAALDFDAQSVYNFDVLYSLGGNIYTNSIVLNLSDTLTSSTSVTAEETDQLTINYADLAGTLDFVARNPGGSFALSGTDASDFTLDGSNNLVSTTGMYLAEGATRTVKLDYTVGGVTHSDNITISLTQALQAESGITVVDGSPVTITPSNNALSKIYSFAQANTGGTWSLASNSADPLDYQDFTINSSTGQITSNAALDYNVEASHIFDVLYTVGGTVFTETVTITVPDPNATSSVTNITAEETDALTIAAANFTETASFVSANGTGGTYSLTGTDAGSFSISNTGVVTSATGVSLRIGSSDVYNYYDTYNFNVVYTVGGLTSTETVKLKITETLESSQTLTAAESDRVDITPSSYISDFAGRDRDAGTYSLSSTSGDDALFTVDGDGNISSRSALDYDTQKTYSFDLNYLASDGRTFTESIALTLTDTLTSTATITTEETESLTIPIAQLTSSQTYQTEKPGGTFSVSGTDAGYFDVNASTGEITTKAGQSLIQADKSTYSVTLDYLDTFGATHSETITITLTEALQGTSTLIADESDLITIYFDDLTKIRGFASRDGTNGSFSIGGTDGASFTINGDGNIESNGALDYSAKDTYVFTLSYTESAASGSDTFVDTITLTLNDTLTSTATVTAEETDLLTIAASEFSSTATYVSRNPGTPAGTYSITGTDAAKFSIDTIGNVTGTDLRYATQSSYDFNILYTADGVTHTEAVTLNLTQTTYGISATNATVVEAEQITLANSVMSYLNAFASADSYGGSFTLGTATTNAANDYVNFEIDSSGNIQSKSTYNIDYDNGQTSFDMDVTYTHSDGVQTYTDRLHIDLTNDFSDDTDLVLASVDISTSAGAREAMNSIGSVIDRMSKTQVILGAKKNQLISNIERLSAGLMQTQVARGRIYDADAASEASRLVKQQILAGAASQMVSLASAQKRGLIDLLV
ncbi:flagellin [Alphaproteobacteria bacterium]|nr:flagellin [Alphaproteobacteria bacterium]